jgi:hypothetical protein
VTIAVGSVEALDVALLIPGPGYSVTGGVGPAAGDGVVAALVLGFFASEYPQWGQKAACRSSSPLHCGQRSFGAGGAAVDAGSGVVTGEVADVVAWG